MLQFGRLICGCEGASQELSSQVMGEHQADEGPEQRWEGHLPQLRLALRESLDGLHDAGEDGLVESWDMHTIELNDLDKHQVKEVWTLLQGFEHALGRVAHKALDILAFHALDGGEHLVGGMVRLEQLGENLLFAFEVVTGGRDGAPRATR